MNIDLLWEEGIPEDSYMININQSHRALEFKHYTNDRYRVCVCDPALNRKYVMTENASYDECCVLIRIAFQGDRCFDF